MQSQCRGPPVNEHRHGFKVPNADMLSSLETAYGSQLLQNTVQRRL